MTNDETDKAIADCDAHLTKVPEGTALHFILTTIKAALLGGRRDDTPVEPAEGEGANG